MRSPITQVMCMAHALMRGEWLWHQWTGAVKMRTPLFFLDLSLSLGMNYLANKWFFNRLNDER